MKHISSVALFAILLTACAQVPEPVHTSYETIVLNRQDVTAPIRWSAVIRGKQDVNICAKTSGNIEEIFVVEGQQVSAGQVLFQFGNGRQRNELEIAQANLLAARAKERNAALEYESHKNLHAQGVISDFLLRGAENALQSAQAEVAQAQAAVGNAQIQLNDTRLTSPVSGVVGDLPYHIGDRLETGQVLTTIAGNRQMHVAFSLTETLVREIVEQVGSLENAIPQLPELTLLFKDGKEYEHKGRVTSFSGLVDQKTGSVTCYATFPNPKGILFSGMQGTVVMPYQYNQVMLAPLTSIVRLQNKTMVYRVGADSTATGVLVTMEELGDGKQAVLISGVEPGDRIVSVGAGNVHEGDQVIF